MLPFGFYNYLMEGKSGASAFFLLERKAFVTSGHKEKPEAEWQNGQEDALGSVLSSLHHYSPGRWLGQVAQPFNLTSPVVNRNDAHLHHVVGEIKQPDKTVN